MKKPRSIVFAGAVFTVGLFALSGCAGAASTADAPSESADAKGEIAFFSPSAQIDVVSALAAGVTEEMEAQGYTVVVHDANFDPVKQAQQIQQALDTRSIVGAWVFPVAPEAAAQSVEALQSAGIPAVIEGPPMSLGFEGPQPGIAFDTPSFVKYGTAIGEAAASCAVQDGHEALFLSPPDSAGGSAAVNEAIYASFAAGAPDVEIVGTAEGADLASAQTAVSQLLIAHPDADVIIAASDETALGAVGAFKAANKTPACIVAGGGGEGGMAAYEAGDITAIISWDYTSAIAEAAEDLIRLMSDPTSVGGIIETPVKASGGN
ncbi:MULTISPECIES: sugar ABC transporter substrate-binding protein [Arthrobacter]|uniref:Substrate-binding domain-containing protein n=1 Tax=Arthrobacter caoxuetaonis TaxID=2886935 RepID=A0A9X1MCR2_9MICC|nr:MULTISPECIES: substrate-binding domain-containing protein [Arthrobacter]MCC3280815.1 substrate-binding domain-containing protein [Arthrobacter caoxuetaonis]MCC3296945.1 substrate-binding domain-containing protein [Arthrobacter caoxuetaonis]MCC9193021.1 substrate-binding domain-containing protein [Arthrobacter sp. zg-Y916]USQ56244.1 substrate-binding domain-containing protein [Arthrobacter caoxuetaonis]